MKGYQKILLIFSSMLFLVGMLVVVVSPVMADEVLIWDTYVLSDGVPVTSPLLKYQKLYRIMADEIWWYNYSANLAADAQYYTTGPLYWDWTNFFTAPDGHSFLQINGQDVDWGPFSNGDTGHTYNIYYTGEEAAIIFRIVDWMDGNYTNNDCEIRVRIYEPETVGGYVVDPNSSEAVELWIISALILTVVITVPVMKYRRKNS